MCARRSATSRSAARRPRRTSARCARSCARSGAGSTRSRSGCRPSGELGTRRRLAHDEGEVAEPLVQGRGGALGGRQALVRLAHASLPLTVAGRRVLITGVASYLGTELARRLERDPEIEYVAGLDTRPPQARLERTDFIEADIRNPRDHEADPADRGRHRRPQPDRAPAGPAHVAAGDARHQRDRLAPAARARASARRRCARSSSAARPASTAPSRRRRSSSPRRWRGSTRCARASSATSARSRTTSRPTRAATRTSPARCCATSRRSGPSADTQVTRYLSLPVVPTYLGFDPRLQFIHEDDAIDALVAAIKNPLRGAVNVAAPGTIGLTRMIRLAGKPSAADRARRCSRRRRRSAAALGLFGSSRPTSGGCSATAARSTRAARRGGRLRPRFDAVEAVEDYLRTQTRPAARAERARPGRGVVSVRPGEHSVGGQQPPRVGAAAHAAAAGRGAVPGRRRARVPAPAARGHRVRVGPRLRLGGRRGGAAGDAQEGIERAMRRLAGDYAEDEWGFDEEFADALFPFLEFMYDRWWRVQVDGRRERPRARARAAGRQPRRDRARGTRP